MSVAIVSLKSNDFIIYEKIEAHPKYVSTALRASSGGWIPQLVDGRNLPCIPSRGRLIGFNSRQKRALHRTVASNRFPNSPSNLKINILRNFFVFLCALLRVQIENVESCRTILYSCLHFMGKIFETFTRSIAGCIFFSSTSLLHIAAKERVALVLDGRCNEMRINLHHSFHVRYFRKP